MCPQGVVPACHNAEDTVTISGPAALVKTFVKELKEKGIFAKEVQSAGVAFHSHYMAAIASTLKTALDKVGNLLWGKLGNLLWYPTKTRYLWCKALGILV